MTLILALWEKSGLFTKLVILWAFGPALLVYLFFGYRDSFKSEIMADTKAQWTQMAEPQIVKRDIEFKSLDHKLTEQGKDIREIRNYLIIGHKQ